MAKVYPLEIKLEAAVEKTTREVLLWIKMIKLFFFRLPKRNEAYQYIVTRGVWLLWIVAMVYVIKL